MCDELRLKLGFACHLFDGSNEEIRDGNTDGRIAIVLTRTTAESAPATVAWTPRPGGPDASRTANAAVVEITAQIFNMAFILYGLVGLFIVTPCHMGDSNGIDVRELVRLGAPIVFFSE